MQCVLTRCSSDAVGAVLRLAWQAGLLRKLRDRRWTAVVLPDRDHRPLTPQSISRLARAALDQEGQSAVRLIDLRHDFILRQLKEHDWQYVSRISGVEAAGLNVYFGAHLKEKRGSTRIRREEAPASTSLLFGSCCGRRGAAPQALPCSSPGRWACSWRTSWPSAGPRWTGSGAACACRSGRTSL